MPQETICAAVGSECIGRHEKRVLQLQRGSGPSSEIVDPIRLRGNNRVAKAKSCTGEFERNARIHTWVITLIGAKRVRSDQMWQKLRISNVGYLRVHKRLGLIVELIA